MKKDSIYIAYILEEINNLQSFVDKPNSRNLYSEDWLVQAGILRTLQTMSETTQRLPDDMKKRHANIPWEDIAGFRNILVHGSLGDIDLDAVWAIINTELAPLSIALEQELEGKQK